MCCLLFDGLLLFVASVVLFVVGWLVCWCLVFGVWCLVCCLFVVCLLFVVLLVCCLFDVCWLLFFCVLCVVCGSLFVVRRVLFVV